MKTGYELPLHVAQAVQRETQNHEVHWVGQSDRWVAMRTTMLIWVFAIPWTLFSLAWTGIAFAAYWNSPSSIAIIAPIWGLPFVAVGFAMMGAPFWVAHICRNTAHVVTGSDILNVTASRGGTTKVKRNPIRHIRSIQRTERPDGFGSLKLTTGWGKDSDGDRVELAEHWVGIPDVRHVEGLITQIRDGAI